MNALLSPHPLVRNKSFSLSFSSLSLGHTRFNSGNQSLANFQQHVPVQRKEQVSKLQGATSLSTVAPSSKLEKASGVLVSRHSGDFSSNPTVGSP